MRINPSNSTLKQIILSLNKQGFISLPQE